MRRRLGIGVVGESYRKNFMPGWLDGSIGYHFVDGKVYNGKPTGRETKGRPTLGP